MYIDPDDPSRKMEQEVNDATAKLKGLLGIGGAAGSASLEKGGESSNQQKQKKKKQEEANDPNSGSGKPPHPKQNKRNRNKNKNNNSRQRGGRENQESVGQQQNQYQQQPQQNRPHSKSPQSRPANNVNKKGGKGKKNKKNVKDIVNYDRNDKDGGGNPNSSKDSSNFAWSAFQSSPDASKLPIPAFSSPANQKDLISVSDESAEQHAISSLLPVTVGGATINAAFSDHNLDNAPKAEDLEKQIIAAPKKDDSETTAPKGEKNVENTKDVPPPSKTGINLAALTFSKQDVASSAKAPGTNSTVTNPAQTSTSTHLQQQQHFASYGRGQPQQQAPQMNYHQYQHQLPHHPYHHPPHGYQPPPPPPGYVTLQVMVPQQLMPGRQMLVNSPAGYPVQVVVPEGVPPHTVIPVHVPAAPLHMMPPQQQQGYHHHQQQQQQLQQQQQQQQAHHQQQRYHNQPGR